MSYESADDAAGGAVLIVLGILIVGCFGIGILTHEMRKRPEHTANCEKYRYHNVRSLPAYCLSYFSNLPNPMEE